MFGTLKKSQKRHSNFIKLLTNQQNTKIEHLHVYFDRETPCTLVYFFQGVVFGRSPNTTPIWTFLGLQSLPAVLGLRAGRPCAAGVPGRAPGRAAGRAAGTGVGAGVGVVGAPRRRWSSASKPTCAERCEDGEKG